MWILVIGLAGSVVLLHVGHGPGRVARSSVSAQNAHQYLDAVHPTGFSAPRFMQCPPYAGTNCLDAAAMLSVNNAYRVRHQGAGVAWNAQLAVDSTAYAAVLANKDNCKLEHSTPQARGNAGENL